MSHPQIVEYFAVFDEGDQVAVVTEWCSQGNMAEFLAADGPFPESTTARYLKGMIHAVE